MRKILRWMFLSAILVLFAGQAVYGAHAEITQKDIDDGVAFCKDYPVLLTVDGKSVTPDVPPVIIKERTLIPARAVFEQLGATVSWDNDTRVVEIILGTSTVKLTVDSDTAFVNGTAVTMEVPAMIIGDRTLIPVRFVAESLSFGVAWEDPSRTVALTSPVIKTRTSINSVEVEDTNEYYRVIVRGDGAAESYKSFAYEGPERFVVDINNATLGTDGGKISSDNDNKIFESVRYAQFDENTVRVVADLTAKVAGKVSFSADKASIFIDFDKDQAQQNQNPGGKTPDGLDVVDWRAAERLVVIDPGHGGKDTGSQAIRDGVEVLNEKDINLDVAMRLNNMLKAAGVRTYILRETDTTITLYDRPSLANAANGDLYIAIHNNSSDKNPNAKGVEVYYNSKSNESNYGLYSKRLAEVAYQELLSTIGTTGRGAKSEPAYAVLNKTQMPAIIIEGSFLSNADDLKLMMTDEFRQNYALATAKAIIQILNESVEQE